MFYYIVIDDEELIRKGTIAKLRSMEDTVACIGEACDGAEALALIEKKNPDMIITDMNMPNMDGTMLLPILAERYPDKPIIVISGYKDFEYTKHAIKAKAVDYLLKPFGKEEIRTSIENAISFLQDAATVHKQIIDSKTKKEHACYEYDIQALKNTILGYYTEKVVLTSQKLDYMNTTHSLLLMTIHTHHSLEETQIQDYLDENGFGDLALYLQHTNNKHLGFLILFIPEQSVLSSENLSCQVAKSLINLLDSTGMSVSLGISRTHNSLDQLHTAFLETVQALNQKHIADKNLFYFYNDCQVTPAFPNWNKQEELLFRIEAGMVPEVQELVHQLFQYFASFPQAAYSDIKYYCFQLTDMTRLILTNYIEQIHQNSISSSTQNILNTMFDLGEIEIYYRQFFTNVATILSQRGVYSTNDVIEKMKIYVQKNYYKNLSVELLSCFFYMSRSYLSHLFKERTGENFVDYLNSIRLEKAKELLENSDKKMYQIAKSAGYDNIKYFFRIFKKKTGMTPEQWRATVSRPRHSS